MSNKSTKQSIIVLILIAVVVFTIVFSVVKFTEGNSGSKEVMSKEKAVETLNKMYKKIDVNTLTPVKGSVDLSEGDAKDSLPDISKYPAQVEATTKDFVEVFSSTEKAGEGTDAWLIEVAKKFNAAGIKVNGKSVSVRIRGIASGLGMDYITSKKYIPDAYTPSNELWGEMLKSKGVKATLAEKRLAGNVAGVLFSKSKNRTLVEKYGSVNLKTVLDAAVNNEIAMGYTNPFASSTGLNFLVSTLYSFDNKNPMSDTAVQEFEKFQTNIPFVAYTTLQMREAAKSGALDGFVLEYQSYINQADLKSDYVFTPFGVRHDNPIYEIGKLTGIKKEILKQFIAFCKEKENQDLAGNYGFNNMDDYKYELGDVGGDVVTEAQKVWKEKKNGARDIAAVFVADVSGSMEGEPLNKLKQSLLKSSKYIGKENSIGLVTFSDEVNINLPIGKFDLNQRALFTGAVENMQATGTTAMFDGIITGAKMLMEEKEKNPDTKIMLFVLTDGETNHGHYLKDVEGVLKGLKIPIYTIGYNANISVLETISNINEAANINADTDDVVYKLENLFNAEM